MKGSRKRRDESNRKGKKRLKGIKKNGKKCKDSKKLIWMKLLIQMNKFTMMIFLVRYAIKNLNQKVNS